ncbi:hypothetical protein Ancab_024831 [Ancistrocladus abbreviatus]
MSMRLREEDQHPPKRIRIRALVSPAPILPPSVPTPIVATSTSTHMTPSSLPSVLSLVVHAPNKVKLVEHIDVPTEGEAANAKVEIDNLIVAEDGIDDHVQLGNFIFLVLLMKEGGFDPSLRIPALGGLEISKQMISFSSHVAHVVL